jgi:hypothetical protein
MSCCAWCEDPIHVPAESAAAEDRHRATSHGICRPCLDRQLAALDRRPVAPLAAWNARASFSQAAAA